MKTCILLLILTQCISIKYGKKVEVIGTAQNAKIGAIIETKNEIYHIDGLNFWSDDIVGKRIRVKGTLHIVERKPAEINAEGLIEQGFDKPIIQKIIKNAKWKLDNK